jgi:hypothetical protein
MIISRTPLRVSLMGAGSDLPEFYESHLLQRSISFSRLAGGAPVILPR